MSEALPSEQKLRSAQYEYWYRNVDCHRLFVPSRPAEPAPYDFGENQRISVNSLEHADHNPILIYMSWTHVYLQKMSSVNQGSRPQETFQPSGTTFKMQTQTPACKSYIQVARLSSLHTYTHVSSATQPSKHLSAHYPQ